MSNYKKGYMTVHDLKDIAMIYNDCDDYKVSVWNPCRMKEMKLTFTGSSNPDKEINFVATFNDDDSLFVLNAIKNALATSVLSEEEQTAIVAKFVDNTVGKINDFAKPKYSYDELVEILAEKVYVSWQEEKHRQGIFDHPDDIPYENLEDSKKEYDRVTVRTVLNGMIENGMVKLLK